MSFLAFFLFLSSFLITVVDSSSNHTNDLKDLQAGDIVWGWQLGSKMDDQVAGVAVDQHGDVFLCGYTLGQFLNSYRPELDPSWIFGVDVREDAWVAKLDGRDGSYIWGWQQGTADPLDTAYATDIFVDLISGDIFVVGGTNGYFFQPNAGSRSPAYGTRDAWAARLDGQNGDVKWTWQHGSMEDEEVLSVTLDPTNGDVLVTGYTHGDFFHPKAAGKVGKANPDRLADPFVCRLDAESGTLLWGWQLKDQKLLEENFHTYAMAIEFDDKGHIYVTGYTGGSTFGENYSGYDDAWVAKLLGQNGGLIWGLQWGHPDGYDFTTSLSINADQDVIITGSTLLVNSANASTKSWVTKISGSGGFVVWEWEYQDEMQDLSIWEYTADSFAGLKAALWAVGNSEFKQNGIPTLQPNESFVALSNEEFGTGWLWLTSLMSSDGSLIWKWKGGTSTGKDQAVGLGHSLSRQVATNSSNFDSVIIAGNTWGDFFKLNSGGSDCWCFKVLVPFYEPEEHEFNYKEYFYKLSLDPFAMGWPLNLVALLGMIYSVIIFINIYEEILDDYHLSKSRQEISHAKPLQKKKSFLQNLKTPFSKKASGTVPRSRSDSNLADESADTVFLFGRDLKPKQQAVRQQKRVKSGTAINMLSGKLAGSRNKSDPELGQRVENQKYLHPHRDGGLTENRTGPPKRFRWTPRLGKKSRQSSKSSISEEAGSVADSEESWSSISDFFWNKTKR